MAGSRSSTVRAGLPITRRTEPSSIRSASCRLLRKSAPQHSLWTAWTSLARPTPPTGQHQKRTCDVLQMPDIFTRSRQVPIEPPPRIPEEESGMTVRDKPRRVGGLKLAVALAITGAAAPARAETAAPTHTLRVEV